MALDLLSATVAATYSLTPRVRQLVLEVDGHTFTHTPGQHVSVRYESDQDGVVYRPYSPVNGPGTDRLVLAVKQYDGGTCSVWLHERTVGDTISVMPPSGNLHLRDPARDAAFLATGTGLTPMMAMLEQYLAEDSGHAVLLYGERSPADLMYRPTLDRLSASHPNLTVEYVLSDTSWNGRTGYVQDHLDSALGSLDAPHAYICGVPQMVVDTQSALRDAGLPDDHIFSEGWEQGAVSN
ncbi:phenol hydroxylase [Salinibacter sp. 10B]|uniref:ferredoxin--NADP reductase n=1 Tax=Salinibacter sp. 10B TaxID=1923971 RepID=UPI000CF439C6|nr:FAD-binding oxidoreductase [Salinibacter sp. 10B]PQJ33586.1 phenol hydroxylase [Salinibacter sp. 10B]